MIKVCEGLLKTSGSHVWLANVAASSLGVALKPPSQNPPDPMGLIAITKALAGTYCT